MRKYTKKRYILLVSVFFFLQIAEAVLEDYIFVHLNDNIDKFNLLMSVTFFLLFLLDKIFVRLFAACIFTFCIYTSSHNYGAIIFVAYSNFNLV